MANFETLFQLYRPFLEFVNINPYRSSSGFDYLLDSG